MPNGYESEPLIALIPLLPLLGVVVIALLNRRLNRKAAGAIATGAVGGSALLSFWTLFRLMGPHPAGVVPALTVDLYRWIAIGKLSVDIGFLADPFSASFMCVVTGVGFLIHLYSVGYMDDPEDAPGVWRYFAYLNLFIFAMLLLVMGSNLLLMFVGWEGVGLCSYLLIGYWYTNNAFASAGKKAFIVNRVGDFCFILGMFWLFWALGDEATLNFTALREALTAHPALLGGVGGAAATGISLLLFGGATGKSAQIPLYVWLPDAMAGPTPVSALIHAATMVTSGIYMVCRLNFLFALSPIAMGVVATTGAVTALYAATIACTQYDIKKVLAYSTVSQLGYMFLGVGVGAFAAGFFHVVTHAFFKALLFLGAGSIIHALHHEQDMRQMGGLRKYMPVTFVTFVAAWFAIIGVPGFSGFFSKDEILWLAWSANPAQVTLPGFGEVLGKVLWCIGAVGAALTAFYMSRLVFMTFFGEYRGHHGGGHGAHRPHESPPIMTVPLLVLGLLATFGGLLNLPEWVPGGISDGLNHFLEPVFAAARMVNPELGFEAATESMEAPLMGATLLMVALSVLIAWWFYIKSPAEVDDLARTLGPIYRGSYNKWYVDEIYDAVIVEPLVKGSRFILWAVVEVLIIDGLVNLAAWAFRGLGRVYGRWIAVGRVQVYALALAAGAAVLVFAYAVAV